jgi:hypothetical protein
MLLCNAILVGLIFVRGRFFASSAKQAPAGLQSCHRDVLANRCVCMSNIDDKDSKRYGGY